MHISDTTTIFGYPVFSDRIETIKLTDQKQIINTLNAYSYVVAKSDPLFKNALQNSAIILPDGFPIVTAAKWLTHKKIKKIAGADIFYYLCDYLNRCEGKCFFLGAAENTLSNIHINLKKEFPNLKAGFFSPPFKPAFTDEENLKMISEVNAFKPDVLFVGMTAPKQEKWVFQNQGSIHAKIICSIGAVFDFYAGSVSRPSTIWIKLNLEWFIRLIKEPRRLWKRYLVYSPIFFIDLMLFKLRIKN
jgi:N-acetylglucosaminyldiphosphoundecaprenol N-acetyl-beta-D-mannosaminyltransferase